MIYSLGGRRVELRGRRHFIAENATLIGSVVLEEEASIWYNAVIRGDNDVITIGERSNIQDGAVLHTDPGIPLTIGRDVTVGHMAMLHGCIIGDGSLIGIKAVILNRAVIGRNCLIGAGSLIPEGKIIPDGSLVMGAPGKIARSFTPEEIERLHKAAASYVGKIDLYARELRAQDPPPGSGRGGPSELS
jgi:carbonic anhydrase/acetyltransferase-like protein (isoleucine patch superfamily)